MDDIPSVRAIHRARAALNRYYDDSESKIPSLEYCVAVAIDSALAEDIAELVELIREMMKRWDALGAHKDDDFGHVEAIVEQMRSALAKWKGE